MNRQAPNPHLGQLFNLPKLTMAALLLIAAHPLLAGTNLWTRSSGLTANVSSISINPQNPAVLYATAGNAIYKSVNGGNDWADGTTLNGGYSYNLVTTHPQSPDYVFVGLSGWGVARSINGGTDWRLQNGSAPYTTDLSGTTGIPPRNPFPPGGVTALAFSRTYGSIGFAAYQGRGVYLSDNATNTVFCPMVDPNPDNDPDTDLPSYCSGYGVGEPDYWPSGFRVNWGAGGVTLASGPDSGSIIPANATINSLIFRDAGPHIYAGSNGQGIYLRSGPFTAPGAWSKTSCGSGGDTGNAVCNVQAMVLSPSEQHLWAATLNNGIWRADVSTGTTTAWSKVSNVAASHACFAALQNVRSLAFGSWFDQASASNKPRVYAGSFGHGVCYTDDDGATWTALNAGLTDSANGSLLGLYITSLVVDPLNPIRVYAGTYAGVYTIQIVPGSSSGGLAVSGSAYNSSTRTLGFGSQAVGQSATQVVSLTNQGLVNVNISGISDTSGDFTSSNTCGATLAPGASCQLFISFLPTVASTYTASLTVRSDASESELTIFLSGTGQGSAGGGSLTANPSSLDFGMVATGNSSSKTVTLTAGSQSITLAEVTVPSGFELVDQCGTLIPAYASCSLTVTFKPTTAVSQHGNLIIQSNAGSSPNSVALTGAGQSSASSGGSLSASLSQIDFGSTPPGTRMSQQIMLTASGGSITLDTISLPDAYNYTSSCGTLIPANTSCSLQLSFSPTATGQFIGSLQIASDAISSPLVINLSGSSADTTTFTGSTEGSSQALSLTGHFRFSSWDARGGGYFYVVGLAGDQLWFFNGSQWSAYAGEIRPPYVKAGPFAAYDSQIFSGINTALLSGASIFLAYGSNIDDAIRNQKYRLIYTFP